ncbi:MAG: efflux RND transporter permease subunit [Proteobacteria bacterium]|nr:efflux RND transporter permease subunit [Pseudomonadota bacterium]MBU1688392.1 efflux RND transporter permease subunit [Pseudomonadota bacterium]
MIVSDTAVDKSTTVMVLAAIILAFGTYCYNALPRESAPDITIPYVFVSADYRGVSPADVETSITIEIEKKLKGIDGVKKIHSVSSEGLSTTSIEFVTGIDIDKALQDVKDKVDEARNDLPSDLENDPTVFEVNFSEMPIVVFSLSGTCGLATLKEIADDLKDDIEAIPGVLEAVVTGGLEREIRVEVLPEKLAYYGISIPVFQQIVASENQNTSGGALRLGDGRFQLRVPGEFKTPSEIYGLVMGTHNGQPVYLKDLAEVVDGFKEETSRSRLDSRSAVNISVKKRSGENIIAITDQLDQLLIKSEKTWPKGTEITKVMDAAKDIRAMVADLENNILTGLVLVVVVLLFFLGLRNAILVSMAIPFSMLLSFTVLYIMGVTLNMVVLFSLTLALGMLVDNAIVIVENIYRYMEQGVPRFDAAKRATSEVAWPVIGSTATTLAAFSPMLFWPGIMGEFMGYLPLTLIVTLSSSLFVAMVINPALAAVFMKTNSTTSQSNKRLSAEQITAAGENPIAIRGWFLKIYTASLRFSIHRPLAMVGIAFACLILLFQVWMLAVGIEKPVEFFPDIDPKSIYVNVDTPEGADLDYIDRILRRIEMAVAGVPEQDLYQKAEEHDAYIEAMAPKEHQKLTGKNFFGPSDLVNIKDIYIKAVSTSGGGSSFESNSPNHVGIQFIDIEERNTPTPETVKTIRQRVKNIPGGKITVAMQEEGPPTGSPINIEIAGDDFQVLGTIAKEIRNYLAKLPSVEDIRDDFVEGTPSVKVLVDRQKAALFGLTTDTIGFALKTAYNGLEVSSFREGDKDYDITVQLREADRRVTDVLRELMVPTMSGQMVPLSTLATVEFSGGLGDIVRIDNQRVVTVKANVDEAKIPGPVARAQAEKLLAQVPLPPGYSIRFTGENVEQAESQAFLSKAFIIACFLIFLILVSMFNSISQPFIIMTSVILSLGGAFLGLAIFRQPFGIIMTGVGVISLAGVVVNNAIVLIDYTNKLRVRGMELKEAVIAAGATRLRPVLLTAITTILGLIPMVTGISYDFRNLTMSWVSESSQWWQSMAVVVIFGLLVATFLTLIVVPTLYCLFARIDEAREKSARWLHHIYWKPYAWLAGEKSRGGGESQ